MPFTVTPITPYQYQEFPYPLGGKHLFSIGGALYYATSAEVGTVEATFNLWVLKSTDNGATWTQVVNSSFSAFGKYVAIAQSGSKIWALDQGQSFSPLHIACYDTGTNTLTASYPAGPASYPYPVSLVPLPDGSVLALYLSGFDISSNTVYAICRFNGTAWGTPVLLPPTTPPYSLQFTNILSVTWDAARIYLFGVDRPSDTKISCLTVDINALTISGSGWQEIWNSAGAGGFNLGDNYRSLGYSSTGNGKVLLPIRVSNGLTGQIRALSASAADSGSLTFSDALVIADTDDSLWNLFNSDCGLSSLSVGTGFYILYAFSNPFNYDSGDHGYLYYQSSTDGVTWAAQTLMYDTPGRDMSTPFEIATSSTTFDAIVATFDPVLFFGFGTKYLGLNVVLLAEPLPVPPLAISCNNPPAGSVGTAYTHTLSISGGTAPYVVSLVSGSLPPNLTLSMGGTISGQPIANGLFSFVVRVVDSATTTAQVACSIQIGSCPDGDVGGPG